MVLNFETNFMLNCLGAEIINTIDAFVVKVSSHMWCVTAKDTLRQLPLVAGLQTFEANQ